MWCRAGEGTSAAIEGLSGCGILFLFAEDSYEYFYLVVPIAVLREL